MRKTGAFERLIKRGITDGKGMLMEEGKALWLVFAEVSTRNRAAEVGYSKGLGTSPLKYIRYE